MPRPERCRKGHNNWIIADAAKGWRRCKTCRDLSNKSRSGPPKGPSWSTEETRRMGRGGSYEDTWSRSELMRIRGYGE